MTPSHPTLALVCWTPVTAVERTWQNSESTCLGFQVKVLTPLQVLPCSLGSGEGVSLGWCCLHGVFDGNDERLSRLWVVHRVSSSLVGPVVPVSRSLSGRRQFTVRRHKFNKYSLQQPLPPPAGWSGFWRGIRWSGASSSPRACVIAAPMTREEH